MENAQNQNVNIDSLLDGTLDDLADAPEFKPFPRGAHRCTINWEVIELNKQPAISLKLTGIETVELSNTEDTPLNAGDSTNILFMLKKADGSKNEFGEGQFKEVLKSLKESGNLTATSNREIMTVTEGMEVLAVTDIRTNKKDPNDVKTYTSIEQISIV